MCSPNPARSVCFPAFAVDRELHGVDEIVVGNALVICVIGTWERITTLSMTP
jgi:hypothetical protein